MESIKAAFHANEAKRPSGLEGERWAVTPEGGAAATGEITTWPGYRPSPLAALPGLAAEAGWSGLWYKDESERFGLGSFKALGGAYAVARLLQSEIAKASGSRPTTAELLDGRHRELTREITVCCATDGNHGRSVAWGAGQFGCRAVIYLHPTVSAAREAAIAQFGAEIVRTKGNYDDSVRQAAEEAAANGWTVISDTSYEGYTEIPCDVMHGYSVMAGEVVQSLGEARPTHVFLQGGVGGMAAAVAAHLCRAWRDTPPRIYLVEPDNAACLFASAKAGAPVTVPGDLDTIMAGLACGEPSLIAWPILQDLADGFLTVSDQAARVVMRRLAEPGSGDPQVVAGESAVAGLAGALASVSDPDLAAALSLGPNSRVLVFGTEGDTDPELYQEIIGRSGAEVRAANSRS